MYQCERRATKCSVKGCHNFYKRGDKGIHCMRYQESHQELLNAEVERLRGEIFNKVCHHVFFCNIIFTFVKLDI